MRKLILMILLVLVVALAACSTPPEDVVRATQVDEPTGDSGVQVVVSDGEVDDTTASEPTEEESASGDESASDDAQEGSDSVEDEESDSTNSVDAASDTSSSVTEVAIDTSASTFEFTGYGPGKEHPGTFEDIKGVLLIDDGVVVGAMGTIQAASVKSDSSSLDRHLKTDDFFDVDNFAEIRMESTSISEGMITGRLTFHGVTKTLMFPVTVTENSVSAETIISLKAFGIEYTGVNDEVKIAFTLQG